MELSWIQKHALIVLLRQPEARVKDLKPLDVETNLFAYHLDRLVAAHLLEKSGRGIYRLTMKGQRLASKYSTDTNRLVEELKTVIAFYARRGDEYLLFRWTRQPLMGKMTLVYDHFKHGQSFEDALHTAFIDKLGVSVPITYKNTAFVRVHSEGELIVHMNLAIYEADVSNVTFPLTMRNGASEFVRLDHPDVMDGVRECIEQLETSSEPFAVEWTY